MKMSQVMLSTLQFTSLLLCRGRRVTDYLPVLLFVIMITAGGIRHVGSSQQAQTQQLVSEWTLHPFLWTMISDSDMLIFITITQHVPNYLRVSWRLMPDDVIKNHREVTKPETTFKILSIKLMFNMRNKGQYWWSLPLTGNTSDLLMILTWLSVWLYRDGIGWNNRKISCNPNSSF